ncbi:hypothetical protein SAMN05216312_12246 [Cohnella sp. OV330]|uniref:hypothetical protein n=1 Tax=Cohnella sp. OV330 TaxID=1855288 RepID=UPI0008E045C6|nr:hypothetical protein [Cohnella sp. OV330]SFB62712.1 hypothetical protein SAMN05216312_12246 [Cohnella sp. OV330]
MEDLTFLLEDPRPDLLDSMLWDDLFRQTHGMADKHLGFELLKFFWVIRSAGVMLKYSTTGYKFTAMLDERCAYDSHEEFEDVKRRYLAPHAKVVANLLARISL